MRESFCSGTRKGPAVKENGAEEAGAYMFVHLKGVAKERAALQERVVEEGVSEPIPGFAEEGAGLQTKAEVNVEGERANLLARELRRKGPVCTEMKGRGLSRFSKSWGWRRKEPVCNEGMGGGGKKIILFRGVGKDRAGLQETFNGWSAQRGVRKSFCFRGLWWKGPSPQRRKEGLSVSDFSITGAPGSDLREHEGLMSKLEPLDHV